MAFEVVRADQGNLFENILLQLLREGHAGPHNDIDWGAGVPGEQCEDCDEFYGKDGLVWRATDDLWAWIGWGTSGLLCPNCFIKRLKAAGQSAYFAAVAPSTYARLMAPAGFDAAKGEK